MHFGKFWNHPSKTRTISIFSKTTRVICPQNYPNQTCDCWLITPNQQKLCIETNIFEQRAIRNQWAGSYKTADNYKIIPLTVQCWLQSTVWLTWSLSIPPENIRKPVVFLCFWAYRKKSVVWNGLNNSQLIRNVVSKCSDSRLLLITFSS